MIPNETLDRLRDDIELCLDQSWGSPTYNTTVIKLIDEYRIAMHHLSGLCYACRHGSSVETLPDWTRLRTCEHLGERITAASASRSCQYWELKMEDKEEPEK